MISGRGSWNLAHFSNPAYDRLSKEFVATPDLVTQQWLAGQAAGCGPSVHQGSGDGLENAPEC
jgi:hypothetical protein